MPDQQKYSNKLSGQHVLIIGGSSGIGYGVAEGSLENGARVTISSSNPTRVAAAVDKLKAAYPSAASSGGIGSRVCDLGDEATIESNIAELFKAVGSVDHVVYTAGDTLATGSIHDASLAQMKQAAGVRFFGSLLAAKEAAKYLSPGPASSFTITSGMVGSKPMPGWTIIGSYAGGHFSMARGLALELKPIRVNVVAPGAVHTELWDEIKASNGQLSEELGEKLPTGRVASVEDVVEAYLYLMKDRNVTGSVISTNGGAMLI